MTDESTPAWNPTPQTPSASGGTSGGASGAVVGAGVILLVIATLLGIFGILAVFAGAIMGQLTNLSGQNGLTEEQADALMTVGRTVIIAFGGVALGLGLAHLLSGIGVLRRRGWARILGLVMSVLGVLFWVLVLASSALAAIQPIPAGYLHDSGLTAEEYRSIAGAGWIVGMALAAIGLAANGFVTVVLIRRGREFA
jgi:hypothetical protein